MRCEKLSPPLSATRACGRQNTSKQIHSRRKTLHVQFNRGFVEYRCISFLCLLCSYNLKCAILEVIFKIEKSQNLHLLHSNLILCHLYSGNIVKFISIAVHKKIVLFIHKGT